MRKKLRPTDAPPAALTHLRNDGGHEVERHRRALRLRDRDAEPERSRARLVDQLVVLGERVPQREH